MTRVIPILLYHSVSLAPGRWISPYTVTPSVFAEHVGAIVESGRTPLTVSALVQAIRLGTLPERPVAVTFDDGFADTGDVAAPLLLERGIPPTVYVTTAFMQSGVGPDGARMLGGREVCELSAAGVEIGAHSHRHRQLDTLALSTVRTELRTSKDLLETALSAPVRSLAYPHGYSSPAVRRAARDAGFASGCWVGNALSHERDDIFRLARLMVEQSTTRTEVAAWLDGHGAPLAPSRERISTRGWRAYRRIRALRRRR